jgi:putative phosphoribosyl transferase
MPRSDRGRDPQRHGRSRPRLRPQRRAVDGAAESAALERSVGLIVLPVTAALSGTRDGLRTVAAGLQDRGFATFLAELLSPPEAEHGYHNFDFAMLADRIAQVTERLRREEPFENLPIGYFGMGTDAAAIAVAAAQPGCPADALVMCHARPELASTELQRIHAPTLFIVKDDGLALDLSRSALAKLCCPGDLAVLRSTGEGLSSSEMASEAAQLAGDWFEKHLCGEQER